MKKTYDSRKNVITIIFISVGIVFVMRLFYLQIIDNTYKLSADNNVLRYVTDSPGRGYVLDRNGKILVYNEPCFDLMVIPKLVKKIDTVSFCNIMNITKDDFVKRMVRAKQYSPFRASIFEKQIAIDDTIYVYLQEKIFQFQGFYFQRRILRKYPNPIAAHALGYIGEVTPEIAEKDPYYKSGDYIGISGIEKSYEKELRGKKGMIIQMVDVFNNEKGHYKDGKMDIKPVAGKNLYSTLDLDVQEYGEKLMKNKRGSIVAIEPSSGEILTLISSPDYDPNLLVGRVRARNYGVLLKDKLKPLFNRALMAKYPPGSTFKLVNALIGLQEGVINPETRFSCERGFHFGGINVQCHEHPSPLDLEESIANSCNAYYCKTFKALIENRKYHSTKEAYNAWRNYVLSFGFGNKFFSDLPHELKGNIPTAEYYDKYHGKGAWRALTIISLSIGQGEIGTTPLQLANLAATIANRGYYYTPHLIKKIGESEAINPRFRIKHKTLVDERYFLPVIEGMHKTMLEGTGVGAKLEGVEICAKTGTAQNPHGKNHSIFIAFAPKDNPKIAISVIIENAGYGATWAAPIASLMIEKYLKRKVSRTEIEERMINANLLE
ncbi:MAG: penicillin-binding protein 2 [Bacteroidota bacterium]|nr:penicillin-binding protein 2 [Bacteroidota bacterium]